MLHEELSKLVQRLRRITGQRVTEFQKTIALKTVDEENLQILQQSLRRHPCVYYFHLSYEKSLGTFCSSLKESMSSQVSTKDIGETLTWINNVAEEIEMERLTSIFSDADKIRQDRALNLIEKLGLDKKPDLNQNDLSNVCPWNVWFTLLSAPLAQYQFSRYKRANFVLPNATPNIRRCFGILESDVHDTDTWRLLLQDIDAFPLGAVRCIWEAALYLFPSCGPLVSWYLRKEIGEAELLSNCLTDDDAKRSYKGLLRILNVFYIHLPLCLDCHLYELFFNFVEEYVEPDKNSLAELYRTSLRRDVGEQLESTEIWNRYIKSHLSTLTDFHKKIDWHKKVLFRMLRTPLKDLDKVKESFDHFILESRIRISPEEEAESVKSFSRSREAAKELGKLMSAIRITGEGNSIFLPRAIRLEEDQEGPQNEMEIWASWHSILEYVKRPALSSGSARDFERFIRFLFWRAAVFPFQIDSWADIAQICMDERFPFRDTTRKKDILQEVIRLSSLFLHDELALQLLHVSIWKSLNEGKEAAAHLKFYLLFHRDELVHSIQGGCDNPLPAAQHLESICVLCVNWMKLPLKHRNRFHIRLIARFVLHTVDFLGLSMGVMKHILTKENGSVQPKKVLQPFHTLCYQWAQLELVRNSAADEAFLILKQWKEYICVLIKTLSRKNVPPESCGADELFIRCCVSIVKASADKLGPVLSLASDIMEIIKSTGANETIYSGLLEQMEHLFFSSTLLEEVSPSFSDVTRRRLLCHLSAPQRLSSSLFQESIALCDFAAVKSSPPLTSRPDNKDITLPQESLWSTAEPKQFASRKRSRDEENAKEKTLKTEGFLSRAVLNLSTNLFTLGQLLKLDTDTPTDKLEKLIISLPSQYQYNPSLPEEDSVSLGWIISLLQKCDGLEC